MKSKKTLLGMAAGLIALGALTFATAQEQETFTEWLERHAVPENHRGLEDSPAGDAIPNLVKYALGLDPLVPSRDALPVVEMREDGRLGMTIPKNASAVDVGIVPEAASALGGWSSEDIEVIEETDGSLTVAATNVAGDRSFLRVQITPPPAGPLPDAYLYVVGGRVLAPDAENVDPELDGLYEGEATGSNVRGILVADINLEDHSVGNWRRAGILPTDHPELVNGDGEPEPLFWLYIHESVQVYNDRLYVGTSGSAAGGVDADFVAWADIDRATGQLGEFSISDRVPGPESNQRIGATALVEVDGTAYYYIMGGSSDAGQTDRILYAAIDDQTGALGEWQVTTNGLPTADWFNAAISDSGKIIHSGGNLRDDQAFDVVTPDSGGDITADWESGIYDWFGSHWDHVMLKAESGGTTFGYVIGGTSSQGTQDTVLFAEIVDGVPQVGEFEAWTATAPLPDVRRRFAGAAIRDMLIIPGGSPTTSFADATNTLFIGVVGTDGEVEWSESEEPLFQARSFHGATIAPAGLADD